jgi:BON domain
MEPNERIEQKRIVLDSPGERREVTTETSSVGPKEFALSPGTIALIVLLAVVAIGITIYVVNNRNENEAANREIASQTNSAQVPPTVIQQPAAPPVIIQQPAAPPVVLEPPAQPSGAVIDDATMQELATKRLADEADLTGVSVAITDGKASLTGNVSSADKKIKAGQVVKAVRGVKTVDNQLTVTPL